MMKALSGTWFVTGAFALLCTGCYVLEEGPLVYGPPETRQTAGDTLLLNASWRGVCRPRGGKITASTCPPVDFSTEVACSRAGCDAIAEKKEGDDRVTIEVTLPPDPGPLDITVTLDRTDDDDTHTETLPFTIHRLTGVDLECSRGSCQSDWAKVITGEHGAVVIGVVGVSQEDGGDLFPSYTARFEPEDGQPAIEILPHQRQACANANRCVPISSPGVLHISGAGFEHRATFAADGTFTID